MQRRMDRRSLLSGLAAAGTMGTSGAAAARPAAPDADPGAISPDLAALISAWHDLDRALIGRDDAPEDDTAVENLAERQRELDTAITQHRARTVGDVLAKLRMLSVDLDFLEVHDERLPLFVHAAIGDLERLALEGGR
jgi:hypothetical protein